jgi:hypothetical protein
MSANIDILIFVEDPGAANCVMGLPNALKSAGVSAAIHAIGSSIEHMKNNGTYFTRVPDDQDASELLDQVSPKLILIGTSENPDTLGLKLIASAKERSIPTIGIIDGPANAQYRFKGREISPLNLAPDLLIVPTKGIKDTFRNMGYHAENIFIGGHPHYDKIKETKELLSAEGHLKVRKRVFSDAHNNVPIIVFAAEISDGLDPSQFYRSSDYTLQGRGQSELRTIIVLEEIIDCIRIEIPNAYLVLRLHPKNTSSEFSEYLSEIDQISDSGSSLEISYGADLVVGMTSILLMEAAILGKPTLSVIPRESEKHWLESIDLGLTPVATSRDELHREMKKFIKSWPTKPDNHVDQVIKFGSTTRIINFLKDTIKPKSL